MTVTLGLMLPSALWYSLLLKMKNQRSGTSLTSMVTARDTFTCSSSARHARHGRHGRAPTWRQASHATQLSAGLTTTAV